MVSLKRRLIQLGSPKTQGEGAPPSCRTVRRGREKEVEPRLPASGQSRGGQGGSEARGRSRETMGRIEGCWGGNEPGVLTPRGRYLQQHGANQRVDGPGAGVAHALEAPEHEPALRENGEEVEHGGSGKGARPAPGAEATIAPTSCCAKRGTRHTSGPGNQLDRTSAPSSGIPPIPRWRARSDDVTGWPVAGLGGALGRSRGDGRPIARGGGAQGGHWPMGELV